MSEPVPNPFSSQQTPLTPPIGQETNFYSQDIEKLKETIEKFKTSGQVDQSELDFAKKEILPKLGLKPEEMNDLGPVGVMVRLQSELEKGTAFENLKENPQTNGKAQTESKTEEIKPINTNGTTAQKLEESNLPEQLSNDQIQKLTHDLSSEIDQEIKRQIAEKHALDLAQEKIDQVLTTADTKPLLPAKVEEKVQPTPPIATTEIKEQVQSSEQTKPTLTPPEHETNTDPLSQSVEFALQNLKEGDKVGSDWTLKKTLATSFGNTKSPFYELENSSGAKWTLSPEEMRETLRAHILSEGKSLEKERPNLAVSKIKPATGHPFESKKTVVPNIVTKPLEQIIKTARKERPEKITSPKAAEEITKKTVTLHDQPKVSEKPRLEMQENASTKVTLEKANLTQKQIDFLGKAHADKESWRALTSLSTEQWRDIKQLYQDGKLIELGIDAHPLIDKLTDPDFSQEIEIRKGDTIDKILTDSGYNLTYTGDDSKIFGAHLIANHQLLVESAHKAEASGFATSGVPTDKDIIDLVYAAENGNHEAFYQLQEPLHQLPIGSKFRIIKAEQLETIKDFFRK